MLYVDPDVADVGLVAGRLEAAASMALQCACVFDVATDILQALADLRGDTMPVYRGVFINENLQRHKKSAQSIKGKHLARFLRQAGMSRARIVLLVGGDVRFDTADAGAHGLSAVLRKPFTKNGFCDVLRSMFRNKDSKGTTEDPPPPSPSQDKTDPDSAQNPLHPPSTAAPSPCAACGSQTPSPATHVHQTHCPPTRMLPSAFQHGAAAATHAAVAAVTATAAAATAAAVHRSRVSALPRRAFLDCLQFTPFPSTMMEQLGCYSGVPSFAAHPGLGPSARRRRYAKIAPREQDEAATASSQEAPQRESTSLASCTGISASIPANTTVGEGDNEGSVIASSGIVGEGKGEGEVGRDPSAAESGGAPRAVEEAAAGRHDFGTLEPAVAAATASGTEVQTFVSGGVNVAKGLEKID